MQFEKRIEISSSPVEDRADAFQTGTSLRNVAIPLRAQISHLFYHMLLESSSKVLTLYEKIYDIQISVEYVFELVRKQLNLVLQHA